MVRPGDHYTVGEPLIIMSIFWCALPGGPGGRRGGGPRRFGGMPGGGPGGIPGGRPGGGPGGSRRGGAPGGARIGGGLNIIGGRPGGGPEI